MSDKLSLIFKSNKFEDFLEKMENLSKISDTIKIKIDQKDILMYSLDGDSAILAFKNYLLKSSDYLDGFDLDQILNIIISNSKRFVRSLSFIKSTENVKCEISYRIDDDSLQSRFIQIKNGKLKVSTNCGENTEIRDISKDSLAQKLDLKNKKWSFSVQKNDFLDIKKLSGINSDGKIIHLNTLDGSVFLSETSTWEILVDTINIDNKHIIINKSYLSNINDSTDIEFHVFETFLMIKDDISNLMISFEQSFED